MSAFSKKTVLDRYRVIVNGHSAKSAITKRTAESYAELARGNGLQAHVEPTQVCEVCGLHRCGGAATCPDA
ncbi:hypothetical protein AB0C27_40385 [Nonomuraea sp. NPDC048882]|uniref:hypothetical protein n=1 Tax=Nonomuraea sp. NPDC048882 TaxID=3154347 RepID=UPI0033D413FA